MDDYVNREIVEYTIINELSFPALITEVQRKISEGWQPLGGAFGGAFHGVRQTMVKYAPLPSLCGERIR
jgi:hypothetical protein